jgi:transcription initiation factor TFIIF subunit beta
MNGIKADPDIKMDVDGHTPSGSGYMDDDFYEDTGELSLPPKAEEKDAWVTRIPKWLYEAVSKYDDFAEGRDDEMVVLGEVLALRDPARPNSVSKTEPMRLILNHRSIAQKQLPQAYELQMTPASKEVLGNTYVFTEKDLPGYKPTGYGQGRMGSFGGVQDPKARIGKRSKYKKAIPSMLHQCSCIYPSLLTETQSKRHLSAVRPASTPQIPSQPKNL